MPEMPEVQTLIDSLIDQGVLNQKIIDVEIFMEKIFKNCSSKQFKEFIINEKIIKLDRIGKYLIFHLSNKKIFIVHLRMEGKLFFEKKDKPYNNKHTLVIIKFSKYELQYHDTRRFGTFHIYMENDYKKSKEISKIALDPLENEFNWKYLKNKISKSTKNIKTVLLDQTKVAGIGNIYADEILFASKIHPETKVNLLLDDDYKNIVKNSKIIMKKAIENKGTTISTYMFKKESIGEFQKYLKVHTKKDFECISCKEKIIKLKVNGRGTYICKNCQLLKIK